MPKKRRPRKPHRRSRPSGPSPAQGTGPRSLPDPRPDAGGGPEEPDLLGAVREALEHPEPLPILATASTLLAVVDPRSADPFQHLGGPHPAGPDLQELLASLTDVDVEETTVLLAVLSELVPDDLTARRLDREVARRRHGLPPGVTGLSPLAVERVVRAAHVLGDGENLLVGTRTATGHPLTAVVYVDHNLGTMVKDAFVVPDTADGVLAQLRSASGDDPDMSIEALAHGDARARIEEAIDLHARTVPPMESDTWPASRALIEWMARHLPEGGRGFARPAWSQADREALMDRFLASPQGRGHDAQDRALLASLLAFACDEGPGDPLRWSSVSVEILLLDWLPRKVMADAALLGRVPALLRSLIRYAHAERGIRASLTEETLAAVDEHEAAYQEAIHDPAPHLPASLLADLGVSAEEIADLFPSHEELVRESLLAAVGGEQALADLDGDPLPDEPFAWERVPAEVHGRVGEVLALLDEVCEEHLGVEVRTACRRLLADVAAADPARFGGRGRADTAAAALAWIVAKANDLLSSSGLTAKRLLGWFGVSGSVSQRADTLLRAIGVERADVPRPLTLGTPRYLVAEKRRAMITERDHHGLVSDAGGGDGAAPE